jgi:glycosyltransferase involved in cell wall biosynthesis
MLYAPAMKSLRILGITNLYPPAARGGYGEICGDVMEALAARGHSVRMLVASEEASGPVPPAPGQLAKVRRELTHVLAGWRHPRAALRATAHDGRIVEEEIAVQRPDVAIVWHMRGLVKPPLRLLHDAGIPVLYMLHDRWVLYERPGALFVPWPLLDRLGVPWLRNVAGRVLGGSRVELRSPPIREEGIVCFVSDWLRETYERRGWRARHAHVVPCGVAVERFRAVPAERAERPRRILFAGRVHRGKGLDVLVRAMAATRHPFELTVAGPVAHPDHAEEIRRIADSTGVAERIAWLGEVPRDDVVRLLRTHDVLAYPSTEVEAYSLGLLEGLAAGILIVTSAVGGPREYLLDGDNSLLFDPGDVEALVAQLDRLADDSALRERLRRGAAETSERLSLDVIVDQVERLLAGATR